MKYVWEELIYIASTRDYNNSYNEGTTVHNPRRYI